MRLIDQNRHSIHAELDNIFCKLDPNLFSQTVNRILDNSILYSPEGELIILKLKRTGHQIELTIEDTGIGIVEQDQPRVFEEFFRGQNVGYRRGIGLGLSIAKKATELCKGSIRFTSQPGQTIFTVTIPIN